jgi:hypothetical protein
MHFLKRLFSNFIFFALASQAGVALGNQVIKVPYLRTFNQEGTCLCGVYSAFHALHVRYQQKEQHAVYLDPRVLRWSQINERFLEHIRGYRNDAYFNNDDCLTEAVLPQDVVRSISEYGISTVDESEIVTIPSFEFGAILKDIVVSSDPASEKTRKLTESLNFHFGAFTGDKTVSEKYIGNDKWIGFIPTVSSEGTVPEGWRKFVLPKDLFGVPNSILAERTPLVFAEDRVKILNRIIESVKNGVPVAFCADSHCRSVDGVEVDSQNKITNFYYADSYENHQFEWDDADGLPSSYSAHKAFVYLIMVDPQDPIFQSPRRY